MSDEQRPEALYAFFFWRGRPFAEGARVKQVLPNGEVYLAGDSSGFSHRPVKIIAGPKGKALMSRLTRLANEHVRAEKALHEKVKGQVADLLSEFGFTMEEMP